MPGLRESTHCWGEIKNHQTDWEALQADAGSGKHSDKNESGPHDIVWPHYCQDIEHLYHAFMYSLVSHFFPVSMSR